MFGHLWVHLTQPTHRHGAAIDSRRAPGTQGRQRVRRKHDVRCIAAQLEHIDDIGLHIVEVERRGLGTPLLRPTCAGRDAAQRFDLAQLAVVVATLQLKFIADLK